MSAQPLLQTHQRQADPAGVHLVSREAGHQRAERDGGLIRLGPVVIDPRGPLFAMTAVRLNCLAGQQGRGYKGIPYFSDPLFPWKTEP